MEIGNVYIDESQHLWGVKDLERDRIILIDPYGLMKDRVMPITVLHV